MMYGAQPTLSCRASSFIPTSATASPSSRERVSLCKPSSEFLAAGDSISDVIEEYPALKDEDVRACIAYGSKLAGNHFQFGTVA